MISLCFLFFFFNDTATTEIYTLSLHDALPIFLGVLPEVEVRPAGLRPHGVGSQLVHAVPSRGHHAAQVVHSAVQLGVEDRKSTRLNSSHQIISYAVFCLKKKKTTSTTLLVPYR